MTAIPGFGSATSRIRAFLLPTALIASVGRFFAASDKPEPKPERKAKPHRGASYYESGVAGRERYRL